MVNVMDLMVIRYMPPPVTIFCTLFFIVFQKGQIVLFGPCIMGGVLAEVLRECRLPCRNIPIQQLNVRLLGIQSVNVNTSVTFSSVSFVPENDLEYNFNHGHFCYLPTSGIETTLYMRHRMTLLYS
jgi:hypothetical protein